jgi:hypothetical protein
VLSLPRSARLAAWGAAVLAGRETAPDAVRAVCGTDEAHVVHGLPGLDGAPGAEGAGPGVAELLEALRSAGAAGLRVALPAPGDPFGLPGPAAFNVEAVDAGEAVLVEGELLLPHGVGRLGLVPEVTEFGSAWEPGATVAWRAEPVHAPPAPEATTLSDAERSLRTALADATRALADLDVARWREDAADRIAAVRDGALGRSELPPGTDPRALRVAASAARVRAIVALAVEDDGAAVTGFEATARARSLRAVDAVARRALAVAVNAAADAVRDTGGQDSAAR